LTFRLHSIILLKFILLQFIDIGWLDMFILRLLELLCMKIEWRCQSLDFWGTLRKKVEKYLWVVNRLWKLESFEFFVVIQQQFLTVWAHSGFVYDFVIVFLQNDLCHSPGRSLHWVFQSAPSAIPVHLNIFQSSILKVPQKYTTTP
jgi:hypothetical protein